MKTFSFRNTKNLRSLMPRFRNNAHTARWQGNGLEHEKPQKAVNARITELEKEIERLELDIARLEEIQESLLECETRFHAFTENAYDLFVEISIDGRILYLSPNHKELLGYDAYESFGRNAFELIHRDDRESVETRFRRAIETFTLSKSIYRLRNIDGEWRWFEGIGKPFRTATGEVRAIIISRDIHERKQCELKVEQGIEKLRYNLGTTIQALANTVEAKDPYTAGHQQRVADLARAIAAEMSVSQDKIDGLRMAGVTHDLGKVSIPTEILTKPSKLSEIEFDLIKVHPQAGYNILKDIEFPWPVAQIVLQHHEKIDGSGYPSGLSREDILLEARILAAADVVEAMTNHRPYRPALGMDRALKELSRNSGVLYEPDAVNACLKLFLEKGFKLMGV